MEKEYIVSLKKGIDYDRFWEEIENLSPDDGFVPSRRVDIVNNRDLSIRSCHYALTDQEAEILRNDPRVAAVNLPPDKTLRGSYLEQIGDFTRNSSQIATHVNWGLRRSVIETLEASVGNSYPYIIDGTGVDIVIQDNGVVADHPEWQDAEGNSRFIQHDWYQVTGTVGSMPAGHYGDVGNHGSHVAGIAAGKTYGWAKNARIYSIRYDLFDSEAFDFITAWHLAKPINPKTGYRRPTIVNQSWGYRWFYPGRSVNQGGSVTEVNYRGVNVGTTLSTVYGNAAVSSHGFHISTVDVDQEEMEDAGIITVKAAGNYYHKIDVSSGADYNNYYTCSTSWALGSIASGNPIYYNQGSSPNTQETIQVANVDSTPYSESLEQVSPSSERGPGVFICAPGTDILSCTNSTGFTSDGLPPLNYPSNSSYKVTKISGTSMAAPQITGMLALYLQINPTATQQDCKNWLNSLASRNSMYSTGLDNDYGVSRSLMGGENRFAFFPYAKNIGSKRSGSLRFR